MTTNKTMKNRLYMQLFLLLGICALVSCKTEIDDGDPFVVWLQGQNGSVSHVVVASGYKTGSTNYLYILDPSPNVDAQYFSYTGLVNGSTGTLGTRCYEKTVLRK